MEIKNIRIEERLIHGQVVTVWLSELKPDRIVIIDNEVVKNDLQKQMLRVACPPTTKLGIFSVDRALEVFASGKYDTESLFILVKNPETIKELSDKGFEMKEVNVGNMAGREGATQVKKAVSVSHSQAEIFRELNSKGIHFTAKMVPSDPNVDFMALVEKL